MIKVKLPLNIILGIFTEVLYALFMMFVAFLICFVFSLKI
jgi:hypothetical protein